MLTIIDRLQRHGYNGPMETEGLLTIGQVAELKSCSKAAVWRAIRENRLASVELLGHRYVHKDKLADWIPAKGGLRDPPGGRGHKSKKKADVNEQ